MQMCSEQLLWVPLRTWTLKGNFANAEVIQQCTDGRALRVIRQRALLQNGSTRMHLREDKTSLSLRVSEQAGQNLRRLVCCTVDKELHCKG